MKKEIMVGVSLAAGFVGGAVVVGILMKKMNNLTNKQNELYQTCYNLVSQWLTCKQKGLTLDTIFKKRGYQSIAIYGMGRLGNMLFEELKNTDIEVIFGIDQDSYCTNPELKIVEPKDKFDKVDAIVVTPVLAFQEIQTKLSEKTEIPVISIEEVMYDI